MISLPANKLQLYENCRFVNIDSFGLIHITHMRNTEHVLTFLTFCMSLWTQFLGIFLYLCQVGSLPIYGVAIPTVDGIRRVLDLVGASRHGPNRHVLWHNLREEPVCYFPRRLISVSLEKYQG